MNNPQNIVRRDGDLIHVSHKQFNGTLKLRPFSFGLEAEFHQRVGVHLGISPDPRGLDLAEKLASLQVAFDEPPEDFQPHDWTSRKLLDSICSEVNTHWDSFRKED